MIGNRVRLVLLASTALALLPGTAVPRAQTPSAPGRDVAPIAQDAPRDFSQDVPAHLSFVDGEVTLERNGKLEPAETNLALLAGDRVRTRGGRVEILYSDGSTIGVDHDSQLDLISNQLARLLRGTIRVTIPHAPDDLDYRVDAPSAFVEIRMAGEFRIDTGVDQHGEPDVALTVVRGAADLVNDLGRTKVRAGRQAVANAKEEPSDAYSVNLANWDEFDQWSDDRRSAHVATGSAAYVPDAVDPYTSVLDDYGTWTTEPLYGAVWYPRVPAAWHPYSQGRWSYTDYYGWLWVGIDPWAWPTHHYGRWGYNNSRWYWIPGQAWSPAWVAWGYAPGYVSWCPLGYDNHSVITWTPLGTQVVSAFRVYDPMSAWTVMPANRFTPNVWVTEHAMAKNAVSQPVRDSFVERRSAPSDPSMAMPREVSAPLRAPTQTQAAVARPRNGSGPFDSARVAGRGTSNATPRDPIRSTIIGTPPDAAARPVDRRVDRSDAALQNGGGASKSVTVLRGGQASDQPLPEADGTRRIAPASADVPRADDRATPPRTIPRPTEPVTYAAPSRGVDSARSVDPSRGVDTALRTPARQTPSDRTVAPVVDDARQRGGAVAGDRSAPAASAPPASAHRPSPPPAASTPSRSQGSEEPPSRGAASAPPSATPAPSQGGGSAVSRPSGGGAATPPAQTGGRGRGGGA